MAGPKNGAPRFLFNGFNDRSTRAVPNDPMDIPTHLPFLLLRSSQGPEDDQLLSGSSLLNMYGQDLFSPRSPYFTHQNYFADKINAAANSVLVKRIVPRDAPAPAGLRIWLEVVKDNIPQYERNDSDGSYKLDNAGERIPTGESVLGNRIRLTVEGLTKDQASQMPVGTLGQMSPREGTLVSSIDETIGTRYPVLELKTPFRGAAGNRRGVRLFAATELSTGGVREDLVETFRTMLLRVQFVERPDEQSGALIRSNLNGETQVEFTLKPDVYDAATDVEYSIEEVLLQAYNAKASGDLPPIFGTFSEYHLYREHLETALKALHVTELPFGTVGDTADDFYMVNFLSAVSYLGTPYHTIALEGPSTGGVIFSENSIHYASLGGDGTLTNEEYDQGVAEFIDGFMDNPLRLWDAFRVPCSVFYDSGFTLPTKLKFPQLLGYRDDVYVVLSTQDASRPINSETEDYSIGQALYNRLRSFPESVLYGTETCRGIILSHAGSRNDTKAKFPIPLTAKFAEDCARYMGAGDKLWDSVASPNENGNNVIAGYDTDFNARAKDDRMIDNFWNSGIIWAQYKDRRDLFIPAYPTVMRDDTSVLKSAFNMIIAVDVIKVCRQVWTDVVGNDRLTREQFATRTDERLARVVRDRYDGRVQVVSQTLFRADDTARGYSWYTRVDLYMNNLLTVGQFEITTNRMEDFDAVQFLDN